MKDSICIKIVYVKNLKMSFLEAKLMICTKSKEEKIDEAIVKLITCFGTKLRNL